MTEALEPIVRELSKTSSSNSTRSKLDGFGLVQKTYAPIQRHSSCRSSSSENFTPRSKSDAKHSDASSEQEKVKTTQLISYIKNGKEHLALSEPRSLYTFGGTQSHFCLWPVELECANFKPSFIYDHPAEREPFHRPEREVPTPPILSADHCYSRKKRVHTVYTNEPGPGEWFTSSRRGPSLNLRPFAPRSQDDVSLSFESRFEGGNLRKAVQVGKWEYELYMRCDLYTDKHTQWFHFAVRNARPGQAYRFTVVNFYKAGSLYSAGMRPLLYSERRAAQQGVGWRRAGFDIKYFKTAVRRPDKKEQFHYALTWCCHFPHEDDTAYFAHCYPYTYSDLKEYIHALCSRPDVSRFCKHRTLCHSVAGNPVPLLTITTPSHSLEEAKSKKAVVVTARIHPGESNSSWMMKGLLDFLTGPHPDARVLRETFVFKVVPMLNPDGVIAGNYRCSLAGRDLNRNYLSDLKAAYPTVWHTKALVQRLAREREVVMYCDLHGHSRKQNVFIYGCSGLPPSHHLKRPPQGLSLLERVFPKMMSQNAPDKFSYKYSTFSVRKSKEGTGRVSMWRQMGILNSFTMEATFCGSSLEGPLQGCHFGTREFEAMGYHLCDTLLDYCDPDQTSANHVLRELQEERRKLILQQIRALGLELPPNTDPLDIEDQVLGSMASDSSEEDSGSDSSASDGAPIGNFDLTPSAPDPGPASRGKAKRKKRRRLKNKRPSVPSISRTRAGHKEDSIKPSYQPPCDPTTPPNAHHNHAPPGNHTKEDGRSVQHSAAHSISTGKSGRRSSATSSVSTAGGTVPLVHYKHRHGGGAAGGIPIYIKERLEERQRRRSDSQTSLAPSGCDANLHLDSAWSLHKLPMGSLSAFWRQVQNPSLSISSLVPLRGEGLDGHALPDDMEGLSPGDLLPTESAHMLASQMRTLMEKCNLPINTTSNLVSLSRFFRNSRPPLGGRRVYMDMVRTLSRPHHQDSQSSLGPGGRGLGGGAEQASTERLPRSRSFTKQELLHLETALDRSRSQVSIPILPQLSTSRSITTKELQPAEKRSTLQLDSAGHPPKSEDGYDSDSDSVSSEEDDDEDNPVVVPMTMVMPGGSNLTPTSNNVREVLGEAPGDAPLPASLSHQEHCSAPPPDPPSAAVPKSFSLPGRRPPTAGGVAVAMQPSVGWQGAGLGEELEGRQSGMDIRAAGPRLSSAFIKAPRASIRQHKDRVAAAVEAIEELKMSSSDCLSGPAPPAPAPRRSELVLPTSVLFSGRDLVEGAALKLSRPSDPLLLAPVHPPTHAPSTLTGSSAGAGAGAGGEGKARASVFSPERSPSKWPPPPPHSVPLARVAPSTTLVDGTQLPSLVERKGGEAHQPSWSAKYASLLERLQKGVEEGEGAGKSSRPATRSYSQRPTSSRPEGPPSGGVVPKPVVLDLRPRITRTSHSKTRPVPHH